MLQSLRGMKDLVDIDSKKYSQFVQVASILASNYGFSFIQTPILEETALFKRSVGDSSDIVNKEMYNFIDKGENDVCLRPEGTAGVVRSFIQNKLDRIGNTKRFFYYGPMFRYERPQKGRFRQFHQFGVESFGESNHFEDLNLILLLKSILDYFNINYKLKINSLGCDKCLLPFKEELVGFLDKHIDGFCEDCKKRKQTNPIRVFDCKNEKCQDILKDAKKLNDSLCNECDEHFEALKKELNNLQIPYEVDSNLVRGLDYYTKTAFEFVSDELGAQSAIAGGGRYDKLVSVLGGKETKAVGFAIGLERIFELLEPQQFDTKKIYIGTMLEDVVSSINKLSYILRQKYEVDISYEAKSLKAHLKKADKIGARYFIFIGEDELKQNKLWLKNLVTKEEKLVNAKELQSVLA